MSDKELVFAGEGHAKVVLCNLNGLRRNEKFCDVMICIEDVKFPCHKCVLAAFSPYFETMFEGKFIEAKQNVVNMKTIEKDIMNLLLDYAYSGIVTITLTNAEKLLSAAHLLQIMPLVNAVSLFLGEHLDASNCLGMCSFAQLYDCKDLREKALNYSRKHFLAVTENDEFLSLSADKLIELTSSNELDIKKEELVFLAVKKWFDFNPRVNKANFHKVMETIRLPLLDLYFLDSCTNLFPAIKKNRKCMQQLEDAKYFHTFPDKFKERFTEQTQPRDHYDSMQLIAAFGGYSSNRNKKGRLQSVECFCPITKTSYECTDLPFRVSSHGVVQCRKSLYLAGGYENNNGTLTNKVWSCDQTLNIWIEVAPMLAIRTAFGLVSLDGYMYAIGGVEWKNRSNFETNSVERYDPNINSWSFVRNLPISVAYCTVVADDKTIYVIGGECSGKVFQRVGYQYDPRIDRWAEFKLASSVAKSAAAGCAINNHIYLMGGSYTNAVWRYDTRNHEFERMSPMNKPRDSAGVTLMNSKIYVLGGFETRDQMIDTIECYDIKNNRPNWTTVGKLVTPRGYFSCLPLHIKKEYCEELK